MRAIFFVFNTENVWAAYEKRSAIPQVEIVSQPNLQEYPKPNGGLFRILGMSFFNPNGYFVELNQFL